MVIKYKQEVRNKNNEYNRKRMLFCAEKITEAGMVTKFLAHEFFQQILKKPASLLHPFIIYIPFNRFFNTVGKCNFLSISQLCFCFGNIAAPVVLC